MYNRFKLKIKLLDIEDSICAGVQKIGDFGFQGKKSKKKKKQSTSRWRLILKMGDLEK